MKFKTSVLLLAVSLNCSHAALAQNLIANGGFESPAIAADSRTSGILPTSWEGTEQAIVNGDFSPGWPLPQEGQQYLSLDHSIGEPRQSFSVAAVGAYLLSWYDSSEFNGPTFVSPYTVFVTNAQDEVVATDDFDANAAGLRVWTPRSMGLSLTAQTYTLHFQSHVSMGGENPLIDAVTLVLPEPASSIQCFIAAAGLFVRGRGRNKIAGHLPRRQ